MPRSRSAISRPMLLITVATIASPASLPSRFQMDRRPSAARRRRRRCGRVIDEQRAIAVAVEGDAEARAGVDDLARQTVEMRRAAIEVDVAAVRVDADRLDVEAERPAATPAPASMSHRWRSRRRSATPPAARHHPGSARGARGSAPTGPPVDHSRLGGHDRPRRVGHHRSRRVASNASVSFSPAPENTLMPLSSYGLCDAEITMPGVKPLGARQIRHRGRRHDAGADYRCAVAGQAARERVLRSTYRIPGCRGRSERVGRRPARSPRPARRRPAPPFQLREARYPRSRECRRFRTVSSLFPAQS